MNPSTFIAIYMPVYIIFLIILPQQRRRLRTIIMKKRLREKDKMTTELIKRYIGRYCTISTGSLGTTVRGLITDVIDNWIEIQTKNGKRLINADFAVDIKIASR